MPNLALLVPAVVVWAALALASEARPYGAEPLPGREAYFATQLADFVRAIQTGQAPRNDAATALPVVRLAESCYASRRPMNEPWVEHGLDTPPGGRVTP